MRSERPEPLFVPVLAMFGGYVSGYTKESNKQPAAMAAFFTLGQAVTLAIVGVLAAIVGKTVLTLFTGYQLDRYIPAVIGIVMGLKLLGILKFELPLMGRMRANRPNSMWGAFSLGIPFGLVGTPCTIPIFILVVSYVAFTANVVHGALLMVVYAIGRGIILLAVAYSAGIIKGVRDGKLLLTIERVSGVLILAASLYLIFFYDVSRTLMPTMPGMGGG